MNEEVKKIFAESDLNYELRFMPQDREIPQSVAEQARRGNVIPLKEMNQILGGIDCYLNKNKVTTTTKLGRKIKTKLGEDGHYEIGVDYLIRSTNGENANKHLSKIWELLAKKAEEEHTKRGLILRGQMFWKENASRVDIEHVVAASGRGACTEIVKQVKNIADALEEYMQANNLVAVDPNEDKFVSNCKEALISAVRNS